jgi:uncharacterized protein DUF2190
MALGDNVVIPLFEPADDLTAAVTAAVTAGKFVKNSGSLQGGPLLDLSGPTTPLVGGNLMQVAQCVAGDKAVGVSKWDAPAVGDVVGLFTGNQVIPMTAGAAITAGVEVQSDANGNPITLAAGRPNGLAVSTAANAATVYIKLYS